MMTEVRAFDQIEFNFKDLPDYHKKLRVDFFKKGISITTVFDGQDTNMLFITKNQLNKIMEKYDD